jgi:predicted GIY-YIG superfamily endonuclease
MISILNYPKIPFKDALLSKEARNCGVYLIYEGENLLYIGKASGQTFKRRLAEHTSLDNQFNTLAKKVVKSLGLSLDKIDVAIDYIEKHFKVMLIPVPMHSYDNDEYSFNKSNKRQEINELEQELIRDFNPPLNKRGKLQNINLLSNKV